METTEHTESSERYVSDVRVLRDWYIVAASSNVGAAPLAVRVCDIPMVLFRGGNGRAAALLDRCPHRNAPLSMGRVIGAHLECGYHGWQFDAQGVCREVPGLCDKREAGARQVTAYPVEEHDGYVWVCPDPSGSPSSPPFRFPCLDDARYTHVREERDVEGSVYSFIENALDVPHTAFLHRGLFRGTGERHDVQVMVRRRGRTVEAEYIGEPRPKGIAARILAPKGGEVKHYDRFILPSIAQVEYRLGDSTHWCITSACTPVSRFQTRLFAIASFRLPLPGGLVARALRPFAMKIFDQDADVLRLQTKNIHEFGEERFMSTELDVLGAQILKMMRQAARGESFASEETLVRELTMRV